MTKAILKEECRRILYKYEANGFVTDSNDLVFLLSVFISHPHYEIKRGSGILAVKIIPTQYNNRCFCIQRIDQTFTDISFIQCIDGASSMIGDIKSACRQAIFPVISTFKFSNVVYGKSTCPFTGELLTKSNTHIDHFNLTFNHLFTNWVKDKSISELFNKINNTSKDGEMAIYFVDQDIVEDFTIYHNQNTHLRAVSKRANLSILK